MVKERGKRADLDNREGVHGVMGLCREKRRRTAQRRTLIERNVGLPAAELRTLGERAPYHGL